jgi:glyoxylase I family protein
MHHSAIICSGYTRSKHFYNHILKRKIVNEHFTAPRNSYKLNLVMPHGSQIELFSFKGAPIRPSNPEAQGLRYLAFKVGNVEKTKNVPRIAQHFSAKNKSG